MEIIFENDKTIQTNQAGLTLLELALENQVPLAHACGGNAKCSTCRVLVFSGEQNLSEPTQKEKLLAYSKGFEKNIRLACQTKAYGNVKLKRLVRDKEDLEQAIAFQGISTGKEMHLTVLFSDIRGYTSFTEKALSYDVIHILNRYFKRMGDIIVKNKGFIDKYIGDGLMALFGLKPYGTYSSEYYAVRCAIEMLDAMGDLNSYLQTNFRVTFEIGIGIHSGMAIVGNIGHPSKIQLTAIGDTVNLASRVESLNKENSTQILITQPVYEKVKDYTLIGKKIQTNIKGKSGTYLLYEVLKCKQELLLADKLKNFLNQKILISDSPSILRLAFHDAFLIPKQEKTYGLKARIFQNNTLNFSHHETLKPIAQTIKQLYSEFTQNFERVSLADFLAFSACVALEKLGGPSIELELSRVDSFDEVLENFIQEENSFSSLLEYFQNLGFSLKEMITLTGAHTVGKAHGKFFTQDPFMFNNSYFKYLLGILQKAEDIILLPSDLVQLESREAKEIIQCYATEEAIFREDFKQAFIKLLNFE